MAAEEDKKFDAVLGGFLVNDLRVRAGDLHCPEADTLAAYHERSLLPEEMNSWKEHIVGCARCQAILSELEATDSLPLQASEKDEILQAVAVTAASAGKPIASGREVTVTLPGKSRVTPISRGARWQWLAPAGAIAASLLVWVAWHENRSQQVKTPAEVQTARLEPPATPGPSVARDDREAASADAARISKDQGVVVDGMVSKTAPETKNLRQFEKPVPRSRVTRSETQADKEGVVRAQTALDSMSAAKHSEEKPVQDGKGGVPAAASQTVEVQTSAESLPLQNQQIQQNLQTQQDQLTEQKLAHSNRLKHVEKAKKPKAESRALTYQPAATPAPKPAPPAAPVPAAAFNDAAGLQMASVISPSVIAAPGGKSLWRAGHAGMIEFSSDGGASWLRQVSSVFADLTAGSAPSDKVCWIVGRAGTVLLTSDAGSHWVTIHSPLAEDLGGVRATDALHATIWNLGNTKTFETSDGGATWKPVASQ